MNATVELIREAFEYDNESGRLIWKERPRSHFTSYGYCQKTNRRWAGVVAGAKAQNRYIVHVFGKRWLLHRLVWAIVHGELPPAHLVIDHINGNGFDNRICNLRLTTQGNNAKNSRVHKNCTSKLKGVYFMKAKGVWRARLVSDGKQVFSRECPTKGLAAVARAKAALKHHGEFARFH